MTKIYNKTASVKDILVVRKHNQIGDMLCSLTLYAALKKKYPYSRITLIASKTNYEIPLKEINPLIDRVIILDRSTLIKTTAFFRELRKRKYDLGVVPSTVKLSRTSHIINFLSGAKTRVGAKSIDGSINKMHYLLNIKSDLNWNGKHQLQRNLEIVQQIGCDLNKEEIDSLKFDFTEIETREATNFIEKHFPDKTKKIIGFHPGAGKYENAWDVKNFVELVASLHRKFKNYILLTSGWTDGAVVSKVEKELKNLHIEYKLMHNYPIKKLGAILTLLNLYVTNDTGTMHIAGFSGAKMISLFGPTNPNEWAPQGKDQFFIKSKTNNINDINVVDVFKKAEWLLINTEGN